MVEELLNITLGKVGGKSEAQTDTDSELRIRPLDGPEKMDSRRFSVRGTALTTSSGSAGHHNHAGMYSRTRLPGLPDRRNLH
jgi:hypothetical protein